jgi:phosphoglucomutase
VASILQTVDLASGERTLVVSGDGRFYNDVAIQTIVKLSAGAGVRKLIIGQHGLLSTPAISNLVRTTGAYGAILLTASHNPGGPDDDFGIKYNSENGGPAPEHLTNAFFEKSKGIESYQIVTDLPDIDLGVVADSSFKVQIEDGSAEKDFQVSVIDGSEAYVAMMKSLFDFDQIKALLSRSDFSILIDGMHGVGGPYATQVFQRELGVSEDQLMRCNSLPDFGKGHPDPNLTYAPELVEKMGILEAKQDAPEFAAAMDGDADRNMILGKNFFVTPSDSVAIIVAQAKRIPYLKGGISGAARSMPTSRALDNVCQKQGLPVYETPTGWKFFGNLLDSDKIAICGEESFGTGSNHVREKDGLWAVMCWLQILADINKDTAEGSLVSIAKIVTDHWAEYGRNYY